METEIIYWFLGLCVFVAGFMAGDYVATSECVRCLEEIGEKQNDE